MTDDPGSTGSMSKSVTVSGVEGINLSVTTYKLCGIKYAALTWSGATGVYVDVCTDGGLLLTTNDTRGSGRPVTYKICESEVTNCSNQVTVIW